VCGTACHNPDACIRATGGCERKASVPTHVGIFDHLTGIRPVAGCPACADQGEPLEERELAPENATATAGDDRPATPGETDPLTTDDHLARAAETLVDRLYSTPAADAVDVALAASDVRTLLARRDREKAAEHRHATVLAAALDRLLAADQNGPGWPAAHRYAVSALAGWHGYLDTRKAAEVEAAKAARVRALGLDPATVALTTVNTPGNAVVIAGCC
jgi:hypothetical protein